MRIVWLTSVRFSTDSITQTGTWLQPLAKSIAAKDGFEVYNITVGSNKTIQEERIGLLRQMIIPLNQSKERIETLENRLNTVLEEVKPDLVHVWGTESIWASINKENIVNNIPVLLDIQGLYHRLYDYYYNGLSPKEILKCLYIKEIIKPKLSIIASKKEYRRLGDIELKNLRTFRYISYQSTWVKEQLQLLNLDATLFSTKIALRNSFYKHIWKKPNNGDHPVIFTISSGSIPYKGFHVLLKALALVKVQIPGIKLRIAGKFLSNSRIDNGYPHYIKWLIHTLELENNVEFVGPLDEDSIVKELLKADVSVIPSFIEAYCLAFAEAMLVGCPTVAAYSGSLPNLADDRKESLFYSPTDYPACAAKILSVLKDDSLSLSLSKKARERRLIENDINEVTNTQINIYESVINDFKK